MTDVAHAATWVMTGPVRPHSIESSAAPIEPDSAGIAKADTNRGPFVSWVWVPSMMASIPPPPVLTTTPTRSRCSWLIAPKSIPLSATASLPAAIAKWMNRVIRRAILGSMAFVGSKTRTSAAICTSKLDGSKLWIRRVPVLPATRFAQYVGKSFPMGMTAPMPVTTARRAGSSSGNGIPQGRSCGDCRDFSHGARLRSSLLGEAGKPAASTASERVRSPASAERSGQRGQRRSGETAVNHRHIA